MLCLLLEVDTIYVAVCRERGWLLVGASKDRLSWCGMVCWSQVSQARWDRCGSGILSDKGGGGHYCWMVVDSRQAGWLLAPLEGGGGMAAVVLRGFHPAGCSVSYGAPVTCCWLC